MYSLWNVFLYDTYIDVRIRNKHINNNCTMISANITHVVEYTYISLVLMPIIVTKRVSSNDCLS